MSKKKINNPEINKKVVSFLEKIQEKIIINSKKKDYYKKRLITILERENEEQEIINYFQNSFIIPIKNFEDKDGIEAWIEILKENFDFNFFYFDYEKHDSFERSNIYYKLLELYLRKIELEYSDYEIIKEKNNEIQKGLMIVDTGKIPLYKKIDDYWRKKENTLKVNTKKLKLKVDKKWPKEWEWEEIKISFIDKENVNLWVNDTWFGKYSFIDFNMGKPKPTRLWNFLKVLSNFYSKEFISEGIKPNIKQLVDKSSVYKDKEQVEKIVSKLNEKFKELFNTTTNPFYNYKIFEEYRPKFKLLPESLDNYKKDKFKNEFFDENKNYEESSLNIDDLKDLY